VAFLMALAEPSTTTVMWIFGAVHRIGGLLLQLTHRLDRKSPQTA
jgi:hypothetical protein